MHSIDKYVLPLPAGPKEKTSKSYEYKLKSIIKKKTNQTSGQGTTLDIITIPNPNPDLAKNDQAFRPLKVRVAGSNSAHRTFLVD